MPGADVTRAMVTDMKSWAGAPDAGRETHLFRALLVVQQLFQPGLVMTAA